MKAHPSGQPTFAARSRAEWRRYLEANHGRLDNTWLVLRKKGHGRGDLTYEAARDEALCFGWVDSVPNKIDDASYFLFFARRRPESNWSRVNKERVSALEAAGLMTESGRRAVETARGNGRWSALEDVENLVVPDDLAAAFAERPPARENWDAFPPSVRRGILEWLMNAKRAETRERRVEQTAALAQVNERANQYSGRNQRGGPAAGS